MMLHLFAGDSIDCSELNLFFLTPLYMGMDHAKYFLIKSHIQKKKQQKEDHTVFPEVMAALTKSSQDETPALKTSGSMPMTSKAS